MNPSVSIRRANQNDLAALLQIEQQTFTSDRLSRRSFKHWLASDHAVLLVAEDANQLAGYGLVITHQGTRLARLYSLAVAAEYRGQGIAQALLSALEGAARDKGKLYLRLEVAKPNQRAIALYQHAGYRVFSEYSDYYDDHADALRMQKCIHPYLPDPAQRQTPWYQQTTEFTCGPAALMMAMASLQPQQTPQQSLELDIWREATTIFMTSGHGGCHPLGLALAAQRRGFTACAYINQPGPLFTSGVRSEHKKAVLAVVDQQFHCKAEATGVACQHRDYTQADLTHWLANGYAVLILISTYRLDGRKAPHWVTLTAIDEHCLYVHDPDMDNHQVALDCQHMPIAWQDFNKMSQYGSERLRTAVVIQTH